MSEGKRNSFTKDNAEAKLGGKASNARNRLTLKLLERFEIRNQDGISVEELLFDIAQNQHEPSEMRFKAAAKLADLVFPKTAQVELQVEEDDSMSLAEMDTKIEELISKAREWEELDPEDKD